MPRALDIALSAARWMLLVAAVLALLLIGLFRTAPGHRLLAGAVGTFTGGTVSVQGLSGALPDNLHAGRVEIADKNGVWLRATDVSLDWHALAALHNRFAIHRIAAAKIALLRMPVSENSEGTTPQIAIGALAFPRIEIAKAAAGHAALLSAQGSLAYVSEHRAKANLIVARLDSPDRYRVDGRIDHDVVNGTISVRENAKGILGALLGLPGLGPVNLSARAAGDAAANTLSLQLSAGALTATGQGTIALAGRSADIAFAANAPAMQPSAQIGWHSLTLKGRVRGKFDAPAVEASFDAANIRAAGYAASAVAARIGGDNGTLDVTGTVSGLRIPGSHPEIFAAAPVKIAAHADLKHKTLPLIFSVNHPLLAMRGKADLAQPMRLAAHVTVPSLAPLASVADIDAAGTAQFNIRIAQDGPVTAIAVDGKLDVQGRSLAAGLLGGNATLLMSASLSGADIAQSHFQLAGAGLRADVTGDFRNALLNYGIRLSLPDLSRLNGNLVGAVSLSGIASGPLDSATLHLSGNANMASRGFGKQNVAIDINARGLTELSSLDARATGSFDNAPVRIAGTLSGQKAALTAKWRSLDAKADLVLPSSGSVATGSAAATIGNLGDIALLTGMKMAGSAKAAIDLKAQGNKTVASVRADASAIAAGGVRVRAARLTGTVADPFGKATVALQASAQDIAMAGATGDAQARIEGAPASLTVALTSRLHDASGNPVQLSADAAFDLPKQRATLSRLDAAWHGQRLALKAPAAIDFAKGLAVNGFAAAIAGGDLDVSGDLTPKLALAVSARNIRAGALQSFFPGLEADGTFSANARLGGTLEAPLGTISLHGRDLRARGYSGKAIALAQLDAEAVLHGDSAKLDATLVAGKSAHLSLVGEVPLQSGARANLALNGTADLAMLNPLLLSNGQQARGTLTVAMHIAGTLAKPAIAGNASIAGGDIQDFARGARLHDIAANIEANGEVLRIAKLSARAGSGTIAGSGTVDLAAPGMPIDIALQAKDARPIASEMMTATLSGDLKLTGHLKSAMTLSGRIFITKGEINLPEKFPPQVAVLNVRRRGEKPPPAPAKPTTVALDLTVSSSRQIFVRGHGIDANLGGRIRLAGTTGAPLVSGGFTMERGTLSLAGQTLDFNTGKVSFNGTGVRQTLDPTLDFVAQTSSGGVTATLTVTGYASQPKIVLTSAPQLPQDEILAHLLFQQSTKQLTALQLAEIAQAIASLGGIGNGFDPIGALRKSLGLDRLAVGSTTGGATGSQQQTTLEAGKYVARKVYVGARQNLSGGTQVLIQVDLTRKLKAQATLSTANNATVTKGSAAQDNGSSVGLSYEFEY